MVRSRSAFTLIELIFAIVIIAITVIALPTMNRVLTQNIDTNLIQEAIFAAATELNEVTTLHWDENSTDADAFSLNLTKVINLDNSCEDNSSSSRYRLRPGHITQPLHRKCLNDLSVGAANSNSDDTIMAIEDMLHNSQEIFLNPTSSAEGYKSDYNSLLSITYSPTFAGTAQANMKKITSTILDADDNVIVKLSTYVANIGEVDYYKRTF